MRKRINDAWFGMPVSQRSALFLVPLALLVFLYFRANGYIP